MGLNTQTVSLWPNQFDVPVVVRAAVLPSGVALLAVAGSSTGRARALPLLHKSLT